MTTFIQIYDKFYDNNNKINIDDIQKIFNGPDFSREYSSFNSYN